MTGTGPGTPLDGPAQLESEEWRRVLTDGHARLMLGRRIFRYLPSAPRCKVCNNPFGGIGGRALALAGFVPSRKNPNLCRRCCDALPVGGAEVDLAVLFADVRGSTALGEGASAGHFAELLQRFYVVATDVLLRHDAIIDKLIGDEVMALFIPGIAGPAYRRRAVEAAQALLGAVGYGHAAGPWLELGAAVHAGPAYAGNVGGAVVDFTALGDTVNVAARLQQHAGSGELIVSATTIPADGPRRSLTLAGRHKPVEVVALTSTPAAIGRR